MPTPRDLRAYCPWSAAVQRKKLAKTTAEHTEPASEGGGVSADEGGGAMMESMDEFADEAVRARDAL
jgi:hypothetical protein